MKRILTLLVAIAIAVIGFFVVKSEPNEHSHKVLPTNNISIEEKKIIPSKTITSVKSEIPKTQIADSWAWETKNYEDDWCHLGELTNEGMDKFEYVIREQQQDQGYFYTDAVLNPMLPSDLTAVDFEEYRSYDIKTLKDLGNQGDLRALTALFEKKEAMNDEKYWAAFTAAVYGGTFLPNMLATQLMMEAFTETLNFNLKSGNKLDYVEALAWSYFSAMRGDLGAWSEFMTHFEKFGRQHFPRGRLNKEDLLAVQLKAHEYYELVMAERKKRNLGVFKASPPKIKAAIQNTIVAEDVALGIAEIWPEEFLPRDNDCFNRIVSWVRTEIAAEGGT